MVFNTEECFLFKEIECMQAAKVILMKLSIIDIIITRTKLALPSTFTTTKQGQSVITCVAS
jgi:hypothetical protein